MGFLFLFSVKEETWSSFEKERAVDYHVLEG